MFLKANPLMRYGLAVLFTTILIVLFYTLLQTIGFGFLLFDLNIQDLQTPGIFSEAEQSLKIRYLVCLFLPFFGIIGALYIGAKVIHRSSFMALINNFGKVDWQRILFAGGLWLLVCFSIDLILFGIKPSDYEWYFKSPDFWISSLIILLLVPIQTSAEELVFRSYFLQFFKRITHSNLVGIILSSGLFAFMHMQNPEVERYGVFPMASYYFLFGVVLCIIVLLDNRLELAIGIHWANNLYAGVFVTYDGAVLQTDALISVSNIHFPTYAILYLSAALLLIYIFYKKYNLALPKQ